ncbi:MAG: hypothetical protein QXH97_04450 [Candidatus Bathyarchaeia archaeon]
MSALSEYSVRKAAYLLGVLRRVGLDLKIDSFDRRLKIQKIVYMLQLHPEFERYLGYSYSLFIRGPYSPDLAHLYYNIPEGLEPEEINLSEEALKYGREIISWNNSFLEIAATLIEAIKINRGRPIEEIMEHVASLKPSYRLEEIRHALNKAMRLKRTYGLKF